MVRRVSQAPRAAGFRGPRSIQIYRPGPAHNKAVEVPVMRWLTDKTVSARGHCVA